MKRFALGLGIAIVLCMGTLVSADTVVVTPTWVASSTSVLNNIKHNDLVNTGASTLASATTTGFTPFDGTQYGVGCSSAAALNDGTSSASLTTMGNGLATFDWNASSYTTVFALNTSVNTKGYNISEIDSYSAWNDPRPHQSYQVYYTTVDNSTWTLLATVLATDASYKNGSLKLALTGTSGGTIASGVNALQFVFATPTNAADRTVYQEVDVLGTAVAVPEPSSIALLAASLLGLLAFAWRKRK